MTDNEQWRVTPEEKRFLSNAKLSEHNITDMSMKLAVGWAGDAQDDAVDHPSHYTAFPLEVIDIIKLCLDEIDRRNLPLTSFQKSCFKDEIKYRFRAGLKGGLEKVAEDIGKAMRYKKFREEAV